MRGYPPDSAEKTMDMLRMTARIAKLRPWRFPLDASRRLVVEGT